jgi:WD40 repeat protein
VSPDGTLLAVLAEQRPPGEFPIRRIHVWDTRSGERRAELDLANGITGGLAFSPDGDHLIVAVNPKPADDSPSTSENLVRRWRTSDFAEQEAITTRTLGDTEFTPDGESLLLAADSRIEVVDPATGEVRRTIATHPSAIRSVAISPDGRTVATTTTSETVVRLWNLADGALVARLTGHTVGLNEVQFSPDGRFLLSAGRDTDVGVWPVDPDAAVLRICADLRAAREHGPGC